jgi:ketosteroid isomerase-like protein
MSQDNVELVRLFHPAPDVDLAAIYRDESRWAQASSLLAPLIAEDFTFRARGYLDRDGETFEGLDGLRHIWLEWLTPWESYRTEIEDIRDLGDDVLVLVRDFGRRAQQTGEIAVASAAVWTVREGKIAQIVFWADRSAALKALGLEE